MSPTGAHIGVLHRHRSPCTVDLEQDTRTDAGTFGLVNVAINVELGMHDRHVRRQKAHIHNWRLAPLTVTNCASSAKDSTIPSAVCGPQASLNRDSIARIAPSSALFIDPPSIFVADHDALLEAPRSP